MIGDAEQMLDAGLIDDDDPATLRMHRLDEQPIQRLPKASEEVVGWSDWRVWSKESLDPDTKELPAADSDVGAAA